MVKKLIKNFRQLDLALGTRATQHLLLRRPIKEHSIPNGRNGKYGPALHVIGAGNGGVWIHLGPAQNYIPGANGCIEIFGTGEWSYFKNILTALGAGDVAPTVTFLPAAQPPLTPH